LVASRVVEPALPLGRSPAPRVEQLSPPRRRANNCRYRVSR